MEDKKINIAAELGKSFIVGIVPITLINSTVMVCLVGLIFVLRTIAKRSVNNDIPILLLIIIFFPAGLYYLWKYSHRTEVIKIIATVFIIGLLVLGKFIVV